MDEAGQRALGRILLDALRSEGVNGVLVGSTAVVALGLFPRTSKDADALAEPGLTLERARAVMARLAAAEGLELVEPGENVVAVVARKAGREAWRMDLLVPGDGLIPPAAARLVHEHAVETDVGRAAVPEHILVMKAVAHGDCVGKRQADRALEYESDVIQLAGLRRKWDFSKVERLLDAFPDARRAPAARLIGRTFGMRLREAHDPNI